MAYVNLREKDNNKPKGSKEKLIKAIQSQMT